MSTTWNNILSIMDSLEGKLEHLEALAYGKQELSSEMPPASLETIRELSEEEPITCCNVYYSYDAISYAVLDIISDIVQEKFISLSEACEILSCDSVYVRNGLHTDSPIVGVKAKKDGGIYSYFFITESSCLALKRAIEESGNPISRYIMRTVVPSKIETHEVVYSTSEVIDRTIREYLEKQ